MRRNQKGFTLMELMVVIVIVAILAAVAVPLYINYVKDATRTEAKGAIGAVITAEQTYFQLNADGGPALYTNDVFIQDPQATPGGQILNCDLTEALKTWDIDVTGASATGFTVNAVGKANTSAAGLEVHFAYSRTGPSTWTEI
jgi:prepilin-type N-terminal cleavage/methylation domain-containing protein